MKVSNILVDDFGLQHFVELNLRPQKSLQSQSSMLLDEPLANLLPINVTILVGTNNRICCHKYVRRYHIHIFINLEVAS